MRMTIKRRSPFSPSHGIGKYEGEYLETILCLCFGRRHPGQVLMKQFFDVAFQIFHRGIAAIPGEQFLSKSRWFSPFVIFHLEGINTALESSQSSSRKFFT